MAIPPRFRERYAPLVDDPEAFFSSLETLLPKSFRVNTLKASSYEVTERFASYGIPVARMPWYPDAFVSGNPAIGSTLEHALGLIYMQELTSMIPPLLVNNELQGADIVLDACAAPGSKTTQLAALMENRGTLVANDISYQRIRALKFNIEKAGALNTVITNQDLRFFPPMECDVVLLDAPCSAEGTIRKNPAALPQWSEKRIHGHARLQNQLIVRAFDLLKPGGTLLYSTCTFAPEENEAVIDYLLGKRPAEIGPVEMTGLRMSHGMTEWKGKQLNKKVEQTRRIWPHQNDTGGFFLARVVK